MGAWWLSCLSPPHCGSIRVSGFAPWLFFFNLCHEICCWNSSGFEDWGIAGPVPDEVGLCMLMYGVLWVTPARFRLGGAWNIGCVTGLDFTHLGLKSCFWFLLLCALAGCFVGVLKRNLKLPWYRAHRGGFRERKVAKLVGCNCPSIKHFLFFAAFKELGWVLSGPYLVFYRSLKSPLRRIIWNHARVWFLF